MKGKSNLNARDYKSETLSLHNIYGKQKMNLNDLVGGKGIVLFFFIMNCQSNISQFYQDIFKTLAVEQQNTQTEAENHYSGYI